MAPSFSVKPRSKALCISSSESMATKLPEATSAESSVRASAIALASLESISPLFCRIAQCAFDERRSYGAKRQSKCTLLDRAKTDSSAPCANRPPHRAITSSSHLSARKQAILSLNVLHLSLSSIPKLSCRLLRSCR